MNTKQMAAEMKVNESDLRSFVGCLRVWTDKGYTIDEAIRKHQDIMSRWAANPPVVVEMVKESLGNVS